MSEKGGNSKRKVGFAYGSVDENIQRATGGLRKSRTSMKSAESSYHFPGILPPDSFANLGSHKFFRKNPQKKKTEASTDVCIDLTGGG